MFTRRPVTIAATVLLAAGTAFVGLPAATAASGSGAQVTQSTTTPSRAPLPQLRQGARGVHVLTLQAALNYEANAKLKGTGYFGPETKKAVVSFQKAHKIKASGIVGPKTWAALGVLNDPNHYPTITLRPGETSSPVEVGPTEMLLTENFLATLHEAFPGWAPEVQSSSTYDAQHVAFIKEFQRRVGIKPSGIIGPQTTRAMSTWLGCTSYGG